jgi:Tol biopolymer transport system component
MALIRSESQHLSLARPGMIGLMWSRFVTGSPVFLRHKRRQTVWLLPLLILLLGLLPGCGWLSPAEPEILYLAPDETGRSQLFLTNIAGTEMTQLTTAVTTAVTTAEADVIDYALSPDGRQIAYTVRQRPQGDAIWLMDSNGRSPQPLLTCPDAQCSHPVWHPDSRRLLYERRELTGAMGTPGAPQLWWLDSRDGATLPLLEVADGPSGGASFSPDGQWVSFVVSPDEGIRLYNFVDGRYRRIASEMGTPAVWSQDGRYLLVRDHYLSYLRGVGAEEAIDSQATQAFTLGVGLYLTHLEGTAVTSISGEAGYDDSGPAWSPDGQWIAFTRKQPKVLTGRQLWLMASDGSNARPLTDEPMINYGPPQWSPDGRYLLTQRYELDSQSDMAGIWLFDRQTNTLHEVVPAGFYPSWQR